MTPPMTPREKVASAMIDTGIIIGSSTWPDEIQVDALKLADAILTALASGSGDHAELARLAEMADWMAAGDLGAEGSVLLAASVAAEHSADLKALLAENAALRAEREGWGENYDRATNLHASTCRDLAEAERKLAVAVDDERARGQVIIDERDKWIVELISERDEARAILRDAVSEAVPDAMIFAGHTDARRYSIALDDLRNWTARARTFLSKEDHR